MADRIAELRQRVLDGRGSPPAVSAAEWQRGGIDAPADDDARRVLADALLEAGDPRGELIQLELALAGGLAIRIRDELSRRHTELVAKHWGQWFPEKVGAIRSRRGFAHSVRGTLHQLLAAGALFDREPIVEVEVTEIDGDSLPSLLAAPWLSRVHHLIIRGKIRDAGLDAIWAAPTTQQLRELNLTADGLGSAPPSGLGDGLPALASLVLTGNHLRAGWLAGLHTWRGVVRLETLYASRCQLGLDGLAGLVAGPLPALRKLCLSWNKLGVEGAELLARHGDQLPALGHLELIGTSLRLAGVEALVDARLPALHKLDVRQTCIPAERPRARLLAPYVVA